MEQNSSEADSSVSMSSRRANRWIIRLFISRRNEDGFFDEVRDWFLYFRNSAPQHRNTRRVSSVKYLDELWGKTRLRIYT